MTESRAKSSPAGSTAPTAVVKSEPQGVSPKELAVAGAEGISLEEVEPTERELARKRLAALRPYLAAGAVFHVHEAHTGRTRKDVSRPVMIVGPIPRLDGSPEVALRQQIRVCTRTSFKDEIHTRPLTDEQMVWLAEKDGLLFTEKRFLAGFSKDGFFEIRRRHVVSIDRLDPAHFLGWLPRPHVEILILKMTKRPLANPYPPQTR